MKRTLATLATIALLSTGMSFQAVATPDLPEPTSLKTSDTSGSVSVPLDNQTLKLTDQQIAQGLVELIDAGHAVTNLANSGKYETTVTLPNGYPSFTVISSQSPYEIADGIADRVWAGYTSDGLWISFNQQDQAALLSGGVGLATFGLCLIPGVGNAACAFLSIAVGVATSYVISSGICPNDKPHLQIHMHWIPARCVAL